MVPRSADGYSKSGDMLGDMRTTCGGVAVVEREYRSGPTGCLRQVLHQRQEGLLLLRVLEI